MAAGPPDLDLKTMQQVESCGFNPIQRKGSGSYGYVYEVSDYQGQLHAFKYILPDQLYRLQGIDGFNLGEIDLLSRINHPYLIHATAIITRHNCEIDGMAVVLPLADRTLLDLIRDPMVTTDMMLGPLAKIARALAFLHQNGILHLDLKSNNIVLQGITENHPYLIDFGLALAVNDAKIGKNDRSERVTLDYRAPELLQTKNYVYNAAVDVWSFGILLLYALRGGRGIYDINWNRIGLLDLWQTIFEMFSDPETVPRLLNDVNPRYRNEAIDLVGSCLQIDPDLRPSSDAIANHPFFAEVQASVKIEGTLIQPPIRGDYGENHRNILKLIFQWAKDIFPEEDVELLFLAIDLYNRTAVFYTSKTPLEQMALAASSLWVAAKFVNARIRTTALYAERVGVLVPDLTSEVILDHENEIIHLTNGILNVNALYKACANLDELDFSYTHIVMNADVKTYAWLILPEWVEIMKQYIPTPARPNKAGSLRDFM